jgi:hypothetical protein
MNSIDEDDVKTTTIEPVFKKPCPKKTALEEVQEVIFSVLSRPLRTLTWET